MIQTDSGFFVVVGCRRRLVMLQLHVQEGSSFGGSWVVESLGAAIQLQNQSPEQQQEQEKEEEEEENLEEAAAGSSWLGEGCILPGFEHQYNLFAFWCR